MSQSARSGFLGERGTVQVGTRSVAMQAAFEPVLAVVAVPGTVETPSVCSHSSRNVRPPWFSKPTNGSLERVGFDGDVAGQAPVAADGVG